MTQVRIQKTVDVNQGMSPLERQIAFIEERCKTPITNKRYHELTNIFLCDNKAEISREAARKALEENKPIILNDGN